MTLIGWIIVLQHQDESDGDGGSGGGDDGELEEAMGHFDAALEQNPGNIEVRERRGARQSSAGTRLVHARSYWQCLPDVHPRHS